jgi:hypothetical protein
MSFALLRGQFVDRIRYTRTEIISNETCHPDPYPDFALHFPGYEMIVKNKGVY